MPQLCRGRASSSRSSCQGLPVRAQSVHKDMHVCHTCTTLSVRLHSHWLVAWFQGKADAAALQSESQSSRQQLSELWAEAEGCREGLEGVRASLDKLDTTMHSIKDNAATTKVTS